LEEYVFARDIHVALATVTLLIVTVATIEGLIRAIRSQSPGVATGRISVAVLFAIGVTAAAGLSLLVSGHRPKEWLHLIYAALAFGMIPVADNAATATQSPHGSGLARFGGGVVALIVVARLFVTG
jgi:hypothetical protein